MADALFQDALQGVPLGRRELSRLAAGRRLPALEGWLRETAARVCRLSPAAVRAEQPLTALGLDSLAAVEIQEAVDAAFGVSLSLDDLLGGPTIAEVAAHLLQALGAAAESERESAAAEPGGAADEPGSVAVAPGGATMAPASAAAEPGGAAAGPGGADGPASARAGERPPAGAAEDSLSTFPLSHGQLALWFLDRLSPASAAYNVAAAARVHGELDLAALSGALADLVARHPVLRSAFVVVEGRPRQRVSPLFDLGAAFAVESAASWDERRCRQRLDEQAHLPFDLESGPPFRVLVLAHSAREHSLLLVLHHLVSDLWSVVVLLADLERCYRLRQGGAPVLEPPPPPAATYAEHVRAQAHLLESPRGAALEAYWRRQLAAPLPQLALPTDRPRPADQTYRGASVPLALAPAVADGLGRLCREQGATLFVGLFAAFAVLLHRLAGQPEVLVGTPTSGRGAAAFRDVVGYFVNPVVLRADLASDPDCSQLLAQLRMVALAALAHQDFPFALLAERLQAERDPSRSPIFQAMFILQKAQRRELERLAGFALGEGAAARLAWADLEFETLRLGWRPAPFDLTLAMAASGEGWAGSLQINADLFDLATAHRMAGHFTTLAAAMAADPRRAVSELPLLAAAEQGQLLREWNDTALGPAARCPVHRAFERQVEATPGATALIVGGESATYQELNVRANQLAHYLRALGVGPEERVGVCLERSLDMVAALLGILKAGGAYVPLDPSYPRARLAFCLQDAGAAVVVTAQRWEASLAAGVRAVRLDADRAAIAAHGTANLQPPDLPEALAYLIYTSGSTGTPKGVMVSHRSVANFFAGIDRCLGSEPGCWLAVTSISFDISVLELLWTLARGFTVVMVPSALPAAAFPAPGESNGRAVSARLAAATRPPLDFSLFYFASEEGKAGGAKYRLLLEGAKLADRRGLAAVWTPERHFHSFGGLYPNPSVTAAAIAAVTERVAIRAGSVVLPLHHPVRVAEEWAVVDNLSGGRVGISFASGWHAGDFVFAPDRYAGRRELLRTQVDCVRRLWRGEAIRFPGGAGEVEVRILPRPVQAELPFWLTAAGSPETFRLAGEMGANLLTHLLGQGMRELGERIALYRGAREQAGHAGAGRVTLMLHTFLGEGAEQVREIVRGPFTAYLASSFDLMKAMAPGEDLADLTEADRQALLARAFDRYFETSGLFGTAQSCLRRLDELSAAGVDEIACLIDFGIAHDAVLASCERLDALRQASSARPAPAAGPDDAGETLPSLIVRYGITHLQCTPGAAVALLADPAAPAALGRLRCLMVGGEALPAALAGRLAAHLRGPLLNMYGPTETTVWSALGPVAGPPEPVTLGRPLANTEIRLIDERMELVPAGRPGELLIGGQGVVRGYWRRPELTAEKFIPDEWSGRPGERVYRTGDLARWLPDGRPLFLGRLDHQVKLRGYRIELGEIEALLTRQPGVCEAVATVREDAPGDQRLVAYLVAAAPPPATLAGRPSAEQVDRVLGGHSRFELPSGLLVAHLSAEQTSALYREIFEQEIYLRHGISLRDGDCVFDVGANIGLFTLFAAARAPRARIHCFEPIPATFEVLRANVALHRLDARLFPLGLSDREEEADFTFYPRMAGLSGRHADGDEEITRAIVRGWLARTGRPGAAGPAASEVDDAVRELLACEVLRCRVRPLSSLIRELGVERIDLLKVDVEKSELEVLGGIGAEDWPKIRQVVLEVHTRELLEQTTALLAGRGFEVAIDELVPVGEWGEAVWMAYARRQPEEEIVLPARLATPAPPVPARPAPVAAAAPPLSVAALRSAVEEQLPPYMWPAAYVVLPALPTTPNGKVNRQALPAPDGRRAGRETSYVAPQDELQRAMAQIWRELLRIDEIGIHDNFFAAGGNSLLLVEAHGRLRRTLEREVTLVELMRYPTIDSLARHLAAGAAGGRPPAAGSPNPAAERGKTQRLAFSRQEALAARARGRQPAP
jgi:natural product biosynthesis luciferase-like monooxygenase protein/FkbM family methyltransferase